VFLKYHAARIVGAFALLLVALGVVSLAVPAAHAEAVLIQKVVVQGNQRIEAATVLSYLAVQPGEKATTAQVDASLKALFATGLFADVTIEQDGGTLIVKVVENPIINRVLFEGNKRLKEEDLAKEVQLLPRTVYTRAKVQSDVQRIVELYRRAGRYASTVEPKLIQLEQNRVNLVFEITEGPKTGVRRINFIGNDLFSDATLRDTLSTKETRWWRFLTQNDSYDQDRLTYDREVLRRFYLSRGYADFRVISAVADLTPDGKDFFITFTVEEGEQYRFGDVDVATNISALDPTVLRPLLTMKPGQIYDVKKIDDSIDALIYAAGTKGYAFVDVRPRVHRDRENHIIGITFEVNEGPRVYVEKININGNSRTLDKVIRREFRLSEGDAFNRVLVDRSKSRIRGLGYFKKVEITEEQGSAPDRTVLNVDVQEQSTGELSLGAGYSSADSILFDASVTERNLLGRGQFLRLRLAASGRRQQVDIRFLEPYFLDRNLSAGFDIFKTRTDYTNEGGFNTDATGLVLRTGFPLTEYSRIAPRYTLRVDDIRVDNAGCTRYGGNGTISDTVCREQGSSSSSILGYTYTLDKRNDPLQPTGGFSFDVSQDVAGLGGSEQYLKTEGGFTAYKAIRWFGWSKVVAKFDASFGYVYAFEDEVNLADRFFKGSSTFRGFKTAGVGPRDTRTSDSLGGDVYGIGTVEVTFPLGLPEELGITGALFSDFGTVGKLDDPNPVMRDDLSLRMSVGVGVLWNSPFGPVRLDFANAMLKEDYDQTEVFRFSAGTRF